MSRTHRQSYSIKNIRPKTLRKLLYLYYHTYVTKKIRSTNVKRIPRIEPGLKATMESLYCKKSAALDYLKAIEIIRKVFVEPEVKQKNLEIKVIVDRDFSHLMIYLSKKISDAVRASGLTNEKIRRQLNLAKADEHFVESIAFLSKKNELFTVEQVCTILKEYFRFII